MEIAQFRDWVIIIEGILEIILIIGLGILVFSLYKKINQLIGEGRQIVISVERTLSNQYYKAGAWILRKLLQGLGGIDKADRQKNKE